MIADLFCKLGKVGTLSVLGLWSLETLKKSKVDETLLKQFLALPKVQIVSKENMESLTKQSSEFRKQVRGVAVGRLG